MVKPIKIKLRRTSDSFILHNKKEDIARLAEAVNVTIHKVNELVDRVNEIAQKINWD